MPHIGRSSQGAKTPGLGMPIKVKGERSRITVDFPSFFEAGPSGKDNDTDVEMFSVANKTEHEFSSTIRRIEITAKGETTSIEVNKGDCEVKIFFDHS